MVGVDLLLNFRVSGFHVGLDEIKPRVGQSGGIKKLLCVGFEIANPIVAAESTALFRLKQGSKTLVCII